MADNRLFELRTYHAAPGKLEALQARFADHTVRLFAKHGLEVVGFWVARDDNGQPGNDLVYVLAFPDSEAREKAWDTFRADPDWIKARADSEADGPLLISLESVLLDPTSYSPLS